MKDINDLQGALHEPSLERKKKLESPTDFLTNGPSVKGGEYPAEDYILLGRNDKFSDNVCYKPKRHNNYNNNNNNLKKKETGENQIRADEEFCDAHMQQENGDREEEEGAVNGMESADVPTEPSLTNEEDYILLGNQAKFSDNVVYRHPRRKNQTWDKKLEREDTNLVENTEKGSSSMNGNVSLEDSAPIEEEEYILLGNQAKLSDNVVYRQRKRRNPMLRKSVGMLPEEEEDLLPVTKKELKPAPVVDTSKYTTSPLVVDNKGKYQRGVSGGGGKTPSHRSVMFDSSSTTMVSNRQQSEPTSCGAISGDNSQETLSDSQHQKPNSLLYKSGLGQPRVSAIGSSEYQNNFTAKEALSTKDDFLNNKNFLYSSHYFDQAYSQNNLVRKTEYQRNFCVPRPQVSPKPPSSIYSETENKDSRTRNPRPSGRSKSVCSVRSLKSDTNTNCKSSRPSSRSSQTSESLRISEPISKESKDSTKNKPKYGLKRTKSLESISSQAKKEENTCFISEYQKNFNSPATYSFVKNAWQNKDTQETTTTAANNNNSTSCQDWYQQVLELRERASQYRQRAFESHICTKHMVQQLSKEAQRWKNSRKPPKTSVLQMKPAGIVCPAKEAFEKQLLSYSKKSTNVNNNQCDIVLEDIEDTSPSKTAESQLMKEQGNQRQLLTSHHPPPSPHHHNHQRVPENQGLTNGISYNSEGDAVENTSKPVFNEYIKTFNAESSHSLNENKVEKSLDGNQTLSDRRGVESITRMIYKDDPRCPKPSCDKNENNAGETRISKGSNSDLLIGSQSTSMHQTADNKEDNGVVNDCDAGPGGGKPKDHSNSVNDELSSYFRHLRATEPKNLDKNTSVPAKTIENTKKAMEDYHLNLASKVTSSYRRPKQVSKSCESMFTKSSAFGKLSKPPLVVPRHPSLPKCKPPENISGAPSVCHKPTAPPNRSKFVTNSSSKTAKPLKSQENLPSRTQAKPRTANTLGPHYEHMSDTYNVNPLQRHGARSRNRPQSENVISETLNSSNSLISDVLERTKSRMNFW
ncbi:uncharacterized protein LOC115217168 [Argonauta hians]